ncbi:MAG: PaaI family thioesterase [Candidatus Thermoplasmatota archaeon]|nr:PaaI family thioesterase [Candidatus Thermoplasmatota archaeon]
MEELHEIDLNDYVDYHMTFLSHAGGEEGVSVRYFLSDQGTLHAKVRFGERSMGPPGHVHGGAMATVLDEAMGIACFFRMLPVVTMSLNIQFLRMVPVGTEAHLETRVEEGEGRDVSVTGRLYNPETGEDFTVASGVYRKLEMERFGPSMKNILSRMK